jgi:hypothetical protein
LQISHGPHFIQEGDKFVAARRAITLVLTQIEGTHTTAKPTKTLSIKTASTRGDIGDATESAEKIKSAREEVNAVMSVLGHYTFKILYVKAPEYILMSDPRALSAVVSPKSKISRVHCQEDIALEEVTTLKENIYYTEAGSRGW